MVSDSMSPLSVCTETCRRLIFFGEGVGGVVDAGERIEVEVRVALGGGDAAMAEKLLYGPEVCPAFQHMRGKGVAQVVRGNVLGYARQFGVFVKDTCGLTAVQSFASFAKEDSPFAMQGRNVGAGFQPSGQSGHAGITEQYLPLF